MLHVSDPAVLQDTHRASPRLPEPLGRFGFEFRRDNQFVQMLRGYRASGGLARRAEVLRRLSRPGLGGEELLDGWMDAGRVCHLLWRDQQWLPLFQFAGAELQPKPAVQQLLAELAPAYIGWDACRWFAEPNSALQGQRPADLVADFPAELHQAARVDRYAVLG